MEEIDARATIIRTVKHLLKFEAMMGADFIPRLDEGKAAPSGASYGELRRNVLSCKLCHLSSTRTNAVFGVGNEKATLMFIGEAPGHDEDLRGEPFVGRAGMLLTKTLQKFSIKRDQVYIANILKCRPPGNRDPRPDEIVQCLPYLREQIAFIAPKVICPLGRISANILLAKQETMTRLRGKSFDLDGRTVFPAFHPAYVLRNMSELATFENDIKQACRLAGML